jgi:hypothetical protein
MEVKIMKRKLTVSMSLALIAVILYGSALAQSTTGQTRNRLMMELAKTDRIIEQARAVIDESNAPFDVDYLRIATERAREMLELAAALQEQALQAMDAIVYDALMAGERQTKEARELAWKAIMIKRTAEGKVEENINAVQRQLEKVERRLEKIRNLLQNNVRERLQATLVSAEDTQRRAWELYHEHHLRAALKLSVQAERSLDQVEEKLRENNRQTQRLQSRVTQLEQRMEQIRIRLRECSDDEARRLVEEAAESLRQCYKYLNQGQEEKAENTLQNTRRLLQNASDLCSGQESLERMIRNLNTEMERETERIMNSGDSDAIKLLTSAQNHLAEAERLCAEAESESCAASIKAAQMNFRRAIRLAGK